MGPANGYYDQSEPARQPSDAYGPARRQANRASALSSLSSGFGDGDIIVSQQQPPPLPPPAAYGRPGADGEAQQYLAAARASWASRRDTIYTENSDDSPPRYRSVRSWVNQQASRVRKADQRGTTAAPDGENDDATAGDRIMPPEPRLNMMMDDGQAPRAPEMMPGPGGFTFDFQQPQR
jgi:hypothetical protein